MPADQDEIDFDNNVYKVIRTYIESNLWNQIYHLVVPSYLDQDPDKEEKVKKLISKYLSPYIILNVLIVNGNVYFYLNKHKMYDQFN